MFSSMQEGVFSVKLIGTMTVTEVAGEYIAVPVGETTEKYRGIVRLNGTALDIWKGLEKGQSEDEIARTLVENYEGVDFSKAKENTHAMIEKLIEGGILLSE